MKINNFLEIWNEKFEANQYIEDYRVKQIHFAKCEMQNMQLELVDVIEELRYSSYQELLTEKLKGIQQEMLYQSSVHGIAHNQRVALISAYLAFKEGIPIEDTEVILNGACYHDIGRTNDEEDTSHGPRGAQMIEKVVQYQNEDKEKLLKAIITIHSIDDGQMDKILEQYEIKEKEIGRKLAKILKDADGLDRVRLKSRRDPTFSYLDAAYLRTQTAKGLIKATHQLNEWFENYIK